MDDVFLIEDVLAEHADVIRDLLWLIAPSQGEVAQSVAFLRKLVGAVGVELLVAVESSDACDGAEREIAVE